MLCELPVTLTISEIAAVSQRSLAEQLMGETGVWTGLWRRLERAIEKHERDEKSKGRKAA